jgi:hypothetical protein
MRSNAGMANRQGMERSVLKRRHIQFRRRGMAQNKEYNLKQLMNSTEQTLSLFNRRFWSITYLIRNIVPVTKRDKIGRCWTQLRSEGHYTSYPYDDA